jgi:hypothetical protein
MRQCLVCGWVCTVLGLVEEPRRPVAGARVLVRVAELEVDAAAVVVAVRAQEGYRRGGREHLQRRKKDIVVVGNLRLLGLVLRRRLRGGLVFDRRRARAAGREEGEREEQGEEGEARGWGGALHIAGIVVVVVVSCVWWFCAANSVV